MISGLSPLLQPVASLLQGDTPGPTDTTSGAEADRHAFPAIDRLRSDRADRLVESTSLTSVAATGVDLVKGAIRQFRDDTASVLDDFGFASGEIAELTGSLLDPVRDALASGSDFTATLMLAAASMHTVSSSAGSEQSFSFVAKSVEIEVNRTTGFIQVSVAEVSIEAHATTTFGGAQPRLFDITDSGVLSFDPFAALREVLDLARPFAIDDEPATDDIEPVAAADDDPEATPVPADDTAPAEVLDDSAGTSAYARITVLAFEHFVNERSEQITRIRLDARIPLELDRREPVDHDPESDTPNASEQNKTVNIDV